VCVVQYSVCVRCVMLVVKERERVCVRELGAILARSAEKFEMRSGGTYST
jgi:hypothetical protein